MAGSRDLTYKIGVDSSQGVAGVKQFSSTVKRELKSIEGDFDDTATAGQKVATVLSAMAKDLDSELDRATQAVDALATALGPELAGKADVGALVADLQRMDLSFEDIVKDADKLAAALKEMDAVQMKGMQSGLGGVKTKFGEMDDSVRGSRSVLANMIGNATQDLGALGGIAGSAGVAIGQMGEYMADATLNGQGLRSVVGDFVKVAGPVAALTAAIGVTSAVIGEFRRESEEAEERTKALGDAMKEAGDDSLAFADVLREDEAALRDFTSATNDPLGTFGVGVDNLLSKIPLVGGVFKEAETDIISTAERAGISIYDLAKQVEDGGKIGGEFTKQLLAARDAGKITNKEMNDLNAKIGDYADSAEDAHQVTKLFNVDQAEANALLKELNAQADPLAQMADQWKILFSDMRDGSIDTKAAADAANRLAENLGKTPDEIIAIADAELDQQFEDAALATEEVVKQIEEARGSTEEAEQAAEDWKASVDEVKVSAAEAMAAFDAERIDAAKTALEEFLAVRQPGVGWLDVLGDTKESLRGLFGQIKDNEGAIPDIFETGTPKGREFRDAIDQASQAVNTQLVQALEGADGSFQKVREEAKRLREQMIERIELRTGLSMDVPAEREKILGLVNAVVPPKRQMEVGIAVDKEDLQKLKADLAIEQLQSLLPATALQLKVDMAEGEITPVEAAATAQRILEEEGVEVDLGVNTNKANDDLILFARQERHTTLSVGITGLEDAALAIDAGPGGQGWPPIHVPVTVDWFNTSGPGGSSMGATPVPGTLSAGPMAAAGVTPMAGPTLPTLMLPVAAAPGRAQQPIIINQTFQTAVMGAPFDIMRSVDEANRRIVRLLPRTP